MEREGKRDEGWGRLRLKKGSGRGVVELMWGVMGGEKGLVVWEGVLGKGVGVSDGRIGCGM